MLKTLLVLGISTMVRKGHFSTSEVKSRIPIKVYVKPPRTMTAPHIPINISDVEGSIFHLLELLSSSTEGSVVFLMGLVDCLLIHVGL